MPHDATSSLQGVPPACAAFAGLRRGSYGSASVRITAGWSLAPLRQVFRNSACVLFARREAAGPLPSHVLEFSGTLRGDTTEAEADRSLRPELVPWPPIATLEAASPYRAQFKQGAVMVPRRFFLVEREQAGRLGPSRAAPRVRGRQGPMDREPWRRVSPPDGPVDVRFLRPLLLGASVAPFRLLETALAVIPVEGQAVLDSEAAAVAGHRHLAAWLRDIETKWAAHASRRADGSPRMTLRQQIDHMRKLSLQLAAPGPKVAYTASGTRLSAAVIEDPSVIVDTSAYWAPIRSVGEARYLCSIINSDVVLQRVIPMQARGWRDPRHFHNLVWELPIPGFDEDSTLHQEIAAAGAEAEATAEAVALPEGDYRRKRRAIRDALARTGLAERMDALVARLLDV